MEECERQKLEKQGNDCRAKTREEMIEEEYGEEEELRQLSDNDNEGVEVGLNLESDSEDEGGQADILKSLQQRNQ